MGQEAGAMICLSALIKSKGKYQQTLQEADKQMICSVFLISPMVNDVIQNTDDRELKDWERKHKDNMEHSIY